MGHRDIFEDYGCIFCGSLVAKVNFNSTCPACGYFISDKFDDNISNFAKANSVITNNILKYQTGCANTAILTDLKVACEVLSWIEFYSERYDSSPQTTQLFKMLNNKRGISLKNVLPLVISYQARINKLFEAFLHSKISEPELVPLSEDEMPF